ncbi:MAG: MGH1-like glycoside hydrolase domain-containing protein [Bacteroidota bacterium]
MTKEEQRLQESRDRQTHWKRWGPYLSERAWGTVREDYSSNGEAWHYLTHEQAISKAYRWGEDGLAGICDRHQLVCFAVALWNGKDPILKERAFGLSSPEGNHGEDVKEEFFYLDSTPTHSYMKYLYKYPHAEFPYALLRDENSRRDRTESEFELADTGVFSENRYFDVVVEYAKETFEDICIRITVTNRGSERAGLDVLPTIWFRNTWSWGNGERKPSLKRAQKNTIALDHPKLGTRTFFCEKPDELLFTENETNVSRLYGVPNPAPYVKDAFHEYIIRGVEEAVNPDGTGTKAAARYHLEIEPGDSQVIKLRLADGERTFTDFDQVFKQRIQEADEFYESLSPADASEDARRVQRQAFAGMLWSKQFYYYDVKTWLRGDTAMPPPPPERQRGRNADWQHLYNSDIISMPDKWEYPWYAAWDLAFHCIPLALVDPDFAKEQLVLMLREWYMHPNGQIPAYEWNFGDVNPPVHAWACWRVYKIDKKRTGKPDRLFLERVFQKLLLNFTWWVNRKDEEGHNLFQGGFLGLDNIGVFDRSAPLPTGGHIEQSDGTSWMAMYTLNMLAIAMELAQENPAYEDVASKFFEHFVHITHAMNHLGNENLGLWDREDGFYYDVLHLPNGTRRALKIRSMVGIIPLFAVETLEPEMMEHLPGFMRRMEWFLNNTEDIHKHIDMQMLPGKRRRLLLSVVNMTRLPRVLHYMLDENEFLSSYGIRSLSRYHKDHPYRLVFDGQEHRVDYDPAESSTPLFGGNSNWRGPIWFPVNYLLIESLQKFHHFAGDEYTVEFPTGSGRKATLWEVAGEISRRLSRLFLADVQGHRAANGSDEFRTDPQWSGLVNFHEYFHGDNGKGLGATHQTGWTGLVAKLLQQSGE